MGSQGFHNSDSLVNKHNDVQFIWACCVLTTEGLIARVSMATGRQCMI